jgi:short-subunit dehydrogenase
VIVLITGATGGLGLVLGQLLASKGLTVYGTSRQPENKSAPFVLLQLDANDPLSVKRCIAEVIDREGRLDVLINCVNELVIAATDEQDMDEVEDLFRTNVVGVMRICQAVLPHYREQGSGLIINMSSLGGILAVPYMGAYTSAKFALEAMTEALYHEVRDEGIRVVIMQPSAMRMDRPEEGAHLRTGRSVAADSFSHQIVKMMARDTVDSKLTPEQVAEKIYGVMTARHSALRVPMEKAVVLGIVKRLVPQRVVNTLIDNLMKGAASL